VKLTDVSVHKLAVGCEIWYNTKIDMAVGCIISNVRISDIDHAYGLVEARNRRKGGRMTR
jgi:hypothetical protein